MNRLRAIASAALLAAVMLTAAPAIVPAAAAGFADRVEATATVMSHRLPAPLDVAASLDDGAATLTWTSPSGDFASAYQVFRRQGACSGWTPAGTPLATVDASPARESHTYADASSLTAGKTYCYAVRAAFEEWVSPFGSITSAAEVSIPAAPAAPEHLYLAPGVLQNADGTGSVQYNPPAANAVYASSSVYSIASNAGWTLSLNLSDRQPGSQTATFTAHLWYANGTCGSLSSAASGGRLIASAATSVTTTGTVVLNLAPNGGFVAPDDARTLCLQLEATDFGMSQQTHFHYTLLYGASTWLKGPVTP